MTTDAMLHVPLIVAGALAVALLFTEADLKWKIACLSVIGACVAMRTVPGIRVPFLVHFVPESAVAISLAAWMKIRYFAG